MWIGQEITPGLLDERRVVENPRNADLRRIVLHHRRPDESLAKILGSSPLLLRIGRRLKDLVTDLFKLP